MLGRTDRRLRSVVLLVILAAFAIAAVLRLSYWQVARGEELRTLAVEQLEKPSEEVAIRGDILDREGRILATTAFRDSLAAYPDLLVDDAQRAGLVDLLAPILGLGQDGRVELQRQLSGDAPYVVIRRELTDEQSEAIRAAIEEGGLGTLALEPHPIRVYPQAGGAPGTTLASQLLGFVTAEGSGAYGVEQRFDTELAGRPRIVASLRDTQGRPLESTARVVEPGADGLDVHLTIDASLQLQLEKELYAAWVADKAQRVSGIILDPHDGSVLAWASVPGYDANDYARVATEHPDLLADPIVSQVYEPGSVMKMFTAAAAIDAGLVSPGTVVKDAHALRFGSDVIHNADRKSLGHIPFRDAIAYSRNIATAKVAMRLGKTDQKSAVRLYQTWQRFGIGQRTGIDVSGESGGIAADPRTVTWRPIDLAERAFGQAVAVTPLQLGVAYTAMANGGFKVQPHVLASIGDQPQAAPAPQRIIGTGLARQLQAIMHHVTASVPWYAEGTLIPHYEVGGKTGTAQVWDAEHGRYTSNLYNFTFGGYLGDPDPRAVVVVRIHEATPKVLAPGNLVLGITSYQLFRRIAVDIIHGLDIPPLTDPDAGMPEPGSAAQKDLQPARFAAWKAARHAPPPAHHNRHRHSNHPGR